MKSKFLNYMRLRKRKCVNTNFEPALMFKPLSRLNINEISWENFYPYLSEVAGRLYAYMPTLNGSEYVRNKEEFDEWLRDFKNAYGDEGWICKYDRDVAIHDNERWNQAKMRNKGE